MDAVVIEANSKGAVDVKFSGGGNTISDAFDTEGCNLVGFLIPDDWDGGATLTFLSAAENKPDTVFKPLVGATGTAIQATGLVAGRVVSVSAVIELRGLRFFKVQAASPVAAKTIKALRVQGAVGQ